MLSYNIAKVLYFAFKDFFTCAFSHGGLLFTFTFLMGMHDLTAYCTLNKTSSMGPECLLS